MSSMKEVKTYRGKRGCNVPAWVSILVLSLLLPETDLGRRSPGIPTN